MTLAGKLYTLDIVFILHVMHGGADDLGGTAKGRFSSHGLRFL